MNKCSVCHNKLPKDKIGREVCSNRCAGSIGGSKKSPLKGYGTNRDLASKHGKMSKPYSKKERPNASAN